MINNRYYVRTKDTCHHCDAPLTKYKIKYCCGTCQWRANYKYIPVDKTVKKSNA